MKADDLIEKLQTRIAHRFGGATFDEDFLLAELDSAISKVAEKRWVEPDELENKYENAVINIALYNLALIGGDFETTHDENGIKRIFMTEQEILKQVTPKARCF